MMRILSITLCFLLVFMLSGCDYEHTKSEKEYPRPVVVLPDENTAYTINGYKDTSASSQNQDSNTDSSNKADSESETDSPYTGMYFGNKNSKKLHKEDCRYAKNMKEENLKLFDSILSAEIEGYSLCSICNQ